MKTYIRRKGTKRWLRFKGHDEYIKSINLYPHLSVEWNNLNRLRTSVECYHEENGTEDYQVYQVTQDKEKIIDIEAEYYMEPQVRSSIL